jgi:hypothetical protein
MKRKFVISKIDNNLIIKERSAVKLYFLDKLNFSNNIKKEEEKNFGAKIS